MSRTRVVQLLLSGLVLLIVAYVARYTYWDDLEIPIPPKREARDNPFYVAQRFVEALGGRTAWDRAFTPPAPDAVVVVSSWHWGLSSRRREVLEQWVESGGRLIVDSLLLGLDGSFERWSGIEEEYPEFDPEADETDDETFEPCRNVSEERDAPDRGGSRLMLCVFGGSWLTSSRPVQWALRDGARLQAVRVGIGRGSVTAVNATFFRERQLFDADHAAIFTAATQLQRGDEVRFLSEDDHPSLLALMWQHGASVVVLVLGVIGLAVWRGAARFGPIAAPPESARRSLAEQIRGSGRFVWRAGGTEPLHTAVLRALQHAAARRIPGYVRLPPDQQTAALASLTGFERSALAAAIHHAGMRRPQQLRDTIALLESARRAVLRDHTGRSHGTD